MRRIATFVLAHKRLVIVGWLIVAVIGAASAGSVGGRLSTSFSLPGQPGQTTQDALLKTFHNGGQAPDLVVITLPAGQTVTASKDALAGLESQLPAAIVAQAAKTAKPGAPPASYRVTGYGDTGDTGFNTSDGQSTYLAVLGPLVSFATPDTDTITAAATQLAATSLPGSTVLITGQQPLASGSTKSSGGPGLLVETLVGALGALLVLAFVFASFLAVIPLIVAFVSIMTTFLLVLLMTTFTDVSFIVQFLVGLIGLGVAIDYSLLVVTRLKEEQAKGADMEEAIKKSMEFAGHAVVFSGVTVAVGLAALVALPVPFLRSVGYGGMLIPLVSTLVSITFLPALLSAKIGGKANADRLDWPRLRKNDQISPAWSSWAKGVVKNRWASAAVALVILGILIAPVLGLKIGVASSASEAKSGNAYQGLQILRTGGIGTGALTPEEVLSHNGDGAAIATAAAKVDGVHTAVTPTAAAWNSGGYAVTLVVPQNETVSSTSTGVVKAVRSALADVPGVQGEAGVGPTQLDYAKAVYGNFPLVLLIISVLTFLLLVRAFRSILLPLKAVILNLVSVSATFGGLVVFWQLGHGSKQVFDIAPTGAITFWLPLMIFAFLFGLSMDYEVFILARMREQYDLTGSTDGAVVEGIGRTGRLVTSAALILFLSFLSLASGPETDIKVFATGLGFGILLDATVVRALLVPSLVSLFGKWNWYLPDSFAKVLRVKPSHALHLPERELELEPA